MRQLGWRAQARSRACASYGCAYPGDSGRMAGFSGHPTLHALLQKGEDEGTLEFGEVATAVEELDLEEGALDAFYAEAERRGIEVLDPARRTGEAAAGFHAAAIAEATSDSLQLFLR